MFDFISIAYYSSIYYHSLMIITIMILMHSMAFNVGDRKSINFFNIFGYVFMIVLILYIGLRPVNGIFVDMKTYAKGYEIMRSGNDLKIENDYFFNYFMKFCAQIMSAQSFFLLVDIIYIIPCYVFSKKYFERFWFYAFFMFVGSFSFWAYGTNGIRNGMATAIFIYALCFYEKKWIMYFLFWLSFMFHSSLVIPITAFIAASFYKNPKLYLYVWMASIPLSLAGGSVWQDLFFNHLGFENRTSGYMEGQGVEGSFSSKGFRWDFLFYSSFGILAGYYFIFIKKITDRFYIHLFGVYTIANSFWVLVITANYSNRFAYLSWFLMAPLIAYPMFKYKIWQDQYKIFGIVLTVYYLFTYFMFLKG